MDHREGADKTGDVRLDFDRRVRLEFHGWVRLHKGT